MIQRMIRMHILSPWHYAQSYDLARTPCSQPRPGISAAPRNEIGPCSQGDIFTVFFLECGTPQERFSGSFCMALSVYQQCIRIALFVFIKFLPLGNEARCDDEQAPGSSETHGRATSTCTPLKSCLYPSATSAELPVSCLPFLSSLRLC